MHPQRSSRRALLAVVFTALAMPLAAQDSMPASRATPPTLASLLARAKASNDYKAIYRELKPEFEAFARAHSGTEEGLEAKFWLLQETWWLREDNSSVAMEAASAPLVAEILAEYPRSKQLGRIAEYNYVIAAAQRVPLFEKVLGQSSQPEVKAAMLLQLGIQGRESKDAAAKALAETRLATLLKDYPNVPSHFTTYGALADAHLHPFAKSDLAIGKMAPEIIGTDVDGKPMKLSDQRGKVIVLDFWGFW